MNFVIVALFVFAFLGIAWLMSRFGGGRPGGTDSTSFPYDNSTIAPSSWSPDSGRSNDAQCTVDDGGWSDGGSDSGSCDSGSSDGGSSGD